MEKKIIDKQIGKFRRVEICRKQIEFGSLREVQLSDIEIFKISNRIVKTIVVENRISHTIE